MMTIEEAAILIRNRDWNMLHFPQGSVGEHGPVCVVFFGDDGITVITSKHDHGEIVPSNTDSIHFIPNGNPVGMEKFVRRIGRIVMEESKWDVCCNS